MFQTAPSHKEKPMHNFTILLTAREKLGPKSQTSLHSALPDQSEFISKAVQVSKLHWKGWDSGSIFMKRI